jgi:hypothetical protein
LSSILFVVPISIHPLCFCLLLFQVKLASELTYEVKAICNQDLQSILRAELSGRVKRRFAFTIDHIQLYIAELKPAKQGKGIRKSKKTAEI